MSIWIIVGILVAALIIGRIAARWALRNMRGD